MLTHIQYLMLSYFSGHYIIVMHAFQSLISLAYMYCMLGVSLCSTQLMAIARLRTASACICMHMVQMVVAL